MKHKSFSTATLPPETELKDYRILSVLQQDALGTLYHAEHVLLGLPVCLREFVPAHCAVLSPENYALTAFPGMEGAVQAAYEEFVSNLRMWGKVRHQALPGVLTAFSAQNLTGTVYAVLPYSKAQPLLQADTSEKRLKPLLKEALDALKYLQNRKLRPVDLTPDCVMVEDGKLQLALFGRVYSVNQPAEAGGTPGYAALEQLQGNKPGLAACIYSLGAVFYHAVSGSAPLAAPLRIGKNDAYIPLVGRPELQGHYSEAFLSTIDKALSLWIEDRWSDFDAWRAALDAPAGAAPAAPGSGLRLGGASGGGLRLGSAGKPQSTGMKLGSVGMKLGGGGGMQLGGSSVAVNQQKSGPFAADDDFDELASEVSTTSDELVAQIAANISDVDDEDDYEIDYSFLDGIDYDTITPEEAAEKLEYHLGITEDFYLDQLPHYLEQRRVIHLMFIAGLDPNRDSGDACPILDIIAEGDYETFELCLKYCTNVNKIFGRFDTTAMHAAIDKNDPRYVELLLKAGANLELQGELNGETPLHYAADLGKADMVRLLIKAGADVNCVNRMGCHILEDVCDEECIRLLKEAGSHYEEEEPEVTDLETIDFDEVSAAYALYLLSERGIKRDELVPALLKAVAEGNVNLVRVLLIAGAPAKGDGKSHGSAFCEPLYGALHHENEDAALEMTRFLLASGLNVNSLVESSDSWKCTLPLCTAIKRGSVRLLNFLIEQGADIDACCGEPMRAAVRKNEVEYLEILHRAGARLDICDGLSGRTPLHDAARWGKTEALRWLIEAGAEVDVCDDKGVHVLNETKDEECLSLLKRARLVKIGTGLSEEDAKKLLVERGIEEDDYAESLLVAARDGDVELVKLLLVAGTDPAGDGEDYGYDHSQPVYMALTYASEKAALEITRVLLDSGLSPDQDLGYESILERAIYCEVPDVVHLLIDRGADVNICFGEGGRPIHAAVTVDNPEYLKILRRAGADLEYCDEFGNTALQYAARNGKAKALRWLIDVGVCLDVSDEYGDHVLDVTTDEECLRLLKEAGCSKSEEDDEEYEEDDEEYEEDDEEYEEDDEDSADTIWGALAQGDAVQLRRFLESYDDVNKIDSTSGLPVSLISYAIDNTPGNRLAACLDELLKAGADIHLRHGSRGMTPLHIAAFRNNYDAICALMAAGADADAKSNDGQPTMAMATDGRCIMKLCGAL